jgi:hypothetical protein
VCHSLTQPSAIAVDAVSHTCWPGRTTFISAVVTGSLTQGSHSLSEVSFSGVFLGLAFLGRYLRITLLGG